jgi:hypothetical protein
LVEKLRGYIDGYALYRFGEEEESPVVLAPPVEVPADLPAAPPPAQPSQPALSILLLRQRQREVEALA